MKQFLNLSTVGRLLYVAIGAFWLGIAIMVGFLVFLSRKTPAVPSSTIGSFVSFDVATANDIELSLPRDGKIVKEPFVTIAGKTAYGTSRVLVATGKGDYFVVQPDVNGTFSMEVAGDEGPNLVSASVFPPNETIRTTRKTFFSFPHDPVDAGDTATLGTVEALGTNGFVLISAAGVHFDVSVSEGVSLAELAKSETVSVVSHGPPDGQKIAAVFVFAKPLYISFIGRVKGVGDSITLLPQVAGAPPVRLIPRRNVRLLRYNDERGVLTPGAIEDLHPGDTVLVDARQVAGAPDVMELRTIIIVPF